LTLFSGGSSVFSIGCFPPLSEFGPIVLTDVLSPMHLPWVHSPASYVMQGITGPEPNVVQGPFLQRQKQERGSGMLSLREDGLHKVLKGLITIEEVDRVAYKDAFDV